MGASSQVSDFRELPTLGCLKTSTTPGPSRSGCCCLLGLVRAAGVEGEFSPYEGTAAKDCGWNLGERLHSVVVGRVDLADEAAADAWQHEVLPDATVTLWANIGVGATRDLSVQSGRTVISVSIRNGPDRTVEQEMAKDTTPQLLVVYQLLPPVT